MKKLINMKLFSIVPSRQDEQDTRAFSIYFFCTFSIQAGCGRFERRKNNQMRWPLNYEEVDKYEIIFNCTIQAG